MKPDRQAPRRIMRLPRGRIDDHAPSAEVPAALLTASLVLLAHTAATRSGPQREAVHMRRAGLSKGAIASALGISNAAVTQRLQRANVDLELEQLRNLQRIAGVLLDACPSRAVGACPCASPFFREPIRRAPTLVDTRLLFGPEWANE
jgi:hypothetical protein